MMNGLKKSKYILLGLLFLFSCATKEKTFLYQGDFFKKENSRINFPYQLTIDISSDFYPAVSPDGQYIVYVSDKSGNLDLWLYDILSRNSYRITYHSSDDTMPGFSENGKKIVFLSFRKNGLGDLYRIDLNDVLERSRSGLSADQIKEWLKDDGAEPITQDNRQKIEPVYFKNKYVYFVMKDTKGTQNIFRTKDKFKAEPEQVTFAGAVSPAFSPDYRQMVYIDISENTNVKNHIILMDLETGGKKQLTFGPSLETRPQFINDHTLIYASIRVDSNKDHKLDMNDHSSLYTLDFLLSRERQLTPENYINYYPVYSRIYNGVIIYTSTIQNAIDLWMLPINGYIPALNDYQEEYLMVRNIREPFLKIAGYHNLLNYKECDKAEIYLNLSRIYQELGFFHESDHYLSMIPGSVIARVEYILNQQTGISLKVKQLELLRSRTNITYRERNYIDLHIGRIYRENKQYSQSIPILERIISSYTNKDEILFLAFKHLAEDYMHFNKVEKIRDIIQEVTNYNDFQGKLDFQNKFIDAYLSKAVDRDTAYNTLLPLFKNDPDLYHNLLVQYASFLKNKKQKKALDLLRYVKVKSKNNYFKVLCLYQFYEINPDDNYLIDILKYGILPERAREVLFNKYLKTAREFFNNGDYLQAREYYNKITILDRGHIGALTGSLRCDFRLMKPSENKYLLLVKKMESSSPYDYVYHYLKGYAYSLIYSFYYVKYKRALQKGDPGLLVQMAGWFKKGKNYYISDYRKKLEQYFKLSGEDLRIAYRIKPDFVEVYLTLGWLYQIHADVDKENFSTYMENSIPFYQSALHFNSEGENPEMESMLCLNLANNYFSLNNYSQALQYYTKKLNYHPEFQDKLQEAFYYFHAGYSAWFLENDTQAIDSFRKAHTNFLSIREHNGAYQSLVFLAMLYRIQNNYPESLKYYQQAVGYIKNQKLALNEERLIREIGISYQNMNDPATALKFLQKALEIIPRDKKSAWWRRPGWGLEFLGTSFTVFPTQFTLGASFAYRGFTNRDEQKLLYTLISDTYQQFLDYKKAVQYLIAKKQLLEEDKNTDAAPYLYNNLGILYFKLNYFSLARDYFRQANELLKKNKKLKDFQGVIINNLNLIEIINKQRNDAITQADLNEIKGLLDESAQMALQNNYPGLLTRIHNAYGSLYMTEAFKQDFPPVRPGHFPEDIRSGYSAFRKALDHFRKAMDISRKNKDILETVRINFNIALIYYHTRDFSTAFQMLTELESEAGQYLIYDLKWKIHYYLLKIKILTGRTLDQDHEYESLIQDIEALPKGYTYTMNNDPLVDSVYNEYIERLISRSRFPEAFAYTEKRRNFKIRENFLSYPLDLREPDNRIMTLFRDQENKMIDTCRKAQQDLVHKFDTKKMIEWESVLQGFQQQKKKELDQFNTEQNQTLFYYLGHSSPGLRKNKNTLLEFNVSWDKLHVFLVRQTNITLVLNKKINPEEARKVLADINQKIKKGKDISSGKAYFNRLFLEELTDVLADTHELTIIPDNILFSFPFALFFPDKDIVYDISLAQNIINQQKQLNHPDNRLVIHHDSRLNSLSPVILNKGPISLNDLDQLCSRSSFIHFPDGFTWDNSINFGMNYNDDYSFSMNGMARTNRLLAFLSLEKTPENFEWNEGNILSLLVPLYYLQAKAVSLNFQNVKEKQNLFFWQNFYQNTNSSYSKRFSGALKAYEDEYEIRNIKMLYGDPGQFRLPGMTNLIVLTSAPTDRIVSVVPSTNLLHTTNARSNQTVREKEDLKTLQEVLGSGVPEQTKRTQVDDLLTRDFSPLAREEAYSLLCKHYEDSMTDLYFYLVRYKKKKYGLKEEMPLLTRLKANEAFLDYFVLGERIYYSLSTSQETKVWYIDQEDFNDLFLIYVKAISEKNEEEYTSTKQYLHELLFRDISDRLSACSRLIIFPDAALFYVPFLFLPKTPSAPADQIIYTVRSYDPAGWDKSREYIFQGYGVQFNPSGKVIMDFSYKEIESLEGYFPESLTKINP
ncbi:MAG: hypothetical protein PHF84_08055, partial [bacterium]|nr:hypothetical protein [bacterium]